MPKLRAGLIGCGRLAHQHCRSVQAVGGLEISAFSDIRKEHAKAYCEAYDGAYYTTRAEDIFSDDSITAVYICTQHDTHADLCIAAAKAGKDIFVEKPLALTVGECLRIKNAVETHGVRIFMAFMMRYFTMIQKARELMPEPDMLVMQMMCNRWKDESWGNDPLKGGGNVFSQGCHSCDILRYMANSEPVEVYAAGGNYYQKQGVIDNLTATFRFKNGAAGCWIQGDAGCPPTTSKFFMEMFAENRCLTLSDRFCTLTFSQSGKKPEIFKGGETGFREENRAFIEALTTGAPMPVNHMDGLIATSMMTRAARSLKSGRPESVFDAQASV